jgi:hypothetical protein
MTGERDSLDDEELLTAAGGTCSLPWAIAAVRPPANAAFTLACPRKCDHPGWDECDVRLPCWTRPEWDEAQDSVALTAALPVPAPGA